MNNNEEIIEEILGFDIKVRTNNNEEKILRFNFKNDFKNDKDLDSTISINKDCIHDDYIYNCILDCFYTIEIKHKCKSYSMEIL